MGVLTAGLTVGFADAADYSDTGFGTHSCSSWTAARATPESGVTATFEQWVLGFISGVEYTYLTEKNKGGRNPLRGMDARIIWAMIDHYCEDHPNNGLEVAAGAVVSDPEHSR
jgi:hypothetical protein